MSSFLVSDKDSLEFIIMSCYLFWGVLRTKVSGWSMCSSSLLFSLGGQGDVILVFYLFLLCTFAFCLFIILFVISVFQPFLF